MAKGLRSSTKKANKAILRHRVFGPVEDARKERLSAKLLELASKSRSKATEADVQMIDGNQEATDHKLVDQGPLQATAGEDMEVDGRIDAVKRKSSKSKGTGRIQKRGRGKANAALLFPVYKKGKRLGGGRKRKN